MAKYYLTEEQFRTLLMEDIIMESLFHKGMSFKEIIDMVSKLKHKGVLLSAAFIASLGLMYHLNHQQQAALEKVAEAETKIEQTIEDLSNKWKLLTSPKGAKANDVVATVYNAVPAQCNNDVIHTASMHKLNLDHIEDEHVIAMERTMMKEFGLKYGDVVKIEGAGQYDGVWRIEDTMNKRFAGQHKIDILVPKNIRTGLWKNVKIYVPENAETETAAKQSIGMSV